MIIEELIRKIRSYRWFCENHVVTENDLRSLVNHTRLSASAANRQPLRFIVSWEKQHNERIFPCMGWTAYLSDRPGSPEGNRPSAYIVITGDTTITDNFWCDHGIVSQNMLLGVREMGLAGCMIDSFNEKKLRQALSIPDHLKILLVIALGKPRETVVIDEVAGQ